MRNHCPRRPARFYQGITPVDCELRNNATYVIVHPTPPMPELYTNVTLIWGNPEENGFDYKHPFGKAVIDRVSRESFVSRVQGEDAVAVVRLDDFLNFSLNRTAFKDEFILKDESPLDVELRDNATFFQIINKYNFKEVDAAATAEGCALVAEHKYVMSIKGVEQLQRLITFIEKYRDLDGVGNVSRFRGKRIIGVLASATEVGGEEQEEMNDLIDRLGYKQICTQGLGYGDDPCSPFQASGDSCDAPASSDASSTGPTAPPSAVPRRSSRSFLAPMRGPAMLVRPGVVNNRVAGFRPYF